MLLRADVFASFFLVFFPFFFDVLAVEFLIVDGDVLGLFVCLGLTDDFAQVGKFFKFYF